jgi:hypothetical protein
MDAICGQRDAIQKQLEVFRIWFLLDVANLLTSMGHECRTLYCMVAILYRPGTRLCILNMAGSDRLSFCHFTRVQVRSETAWLRGCATMSSISINNIVGRCCVSPSILLDDGLPERARH